MSFPTAVMFLLSAFGIYFLYRSTFVRSYSMSTIFLSGITLLIFLINIAIITGSLIGVQTGMENLFIRIPDYEQLNKSLAGLPAFPTMISFLLFGIASIFSLTIGLKRLLFIGFFGYPIVIIGFVAVVGYVLNIPLLYYKIVDASTPMAFNTALTFILLGGSLIAISRLDNLHET